MIWHLAHSFVGLPCRREAQLSRRRWFSWRRSVEPAGAEPCGASDHDEIALAVRDSVTRFLCANGIDYDPVGSGGSWLWCLGGPSLYRDSAADDNSGSCVDLNVGVCVEHELITAELYPYDIVPEAGGSSIENPRRSTPLPLGDDGATVVSNFTRYLETWLDEILVRPIDTPPHSPNGRL